MFSGVVKITHLQKHLEKQKRASVDEGVENWGTLLHSSSAGKESTCNAGDLGSILGTIRWVPTPVFLGFPGGSAGKESSCDAGDLGSIPGLGRPPGEGNGHPLQCSALENSTDCIVHGVGHD